MRGASNVEKGRGVEGGGVVKWRRVGGKGKRLVKGTMHGNWRGEGARCEMQYLGAWEYKDDDAVFHGAEKASKTVFIHIS